jgi:hypothetical protein
MCEQILVKIPIMKFQENLPSGNRAVQCRQTGKTRLAIAIHFANAPVCVLQTSLVCSDTIKHMHQ